MTTFDHQNPVDTYLLGNGRKPLHITIISVVLFLIYLASLSWISQDPVKSADTVVFVHHDETGVGIVTEVRKYVGYRVEQVFTSSYMYEEANRANFFVIEGGSLTSFEGEFSVMRIVVVPSWVTGRWCTSTKVSWRPQWSQRMFSMDTKDVCFETSEYE